jgi:hypothetical protein
MSAQFRYEFKGPLFENPKNSTKEAVQSALAGTAKFAEDGARLDSRVRTGRMRRGWNTRPVTWDKYLVRNFVPYVTVWEHRDGILRNNIPRIQRYLDQRLGEEISDKLN